MFSSYGLDYLENRKIKKYKKIMSKGLAWHVCLNLQLENITIFFEHFFSKKYPSFMFYGAGKFYMLYGAGKKHILNRSQYWIVSSI